MMKHLILFSFVLASFGSWAQYNWKPGKSKNGISVYTSDVAGSSFKAVKVDCTLTGTFTKLISILSNVADFSDWIYNNKTSKLLKSYSPHDFLYYSETSMPFPFNNRDVIIRMQLNTDSLPKFMTINGYNVDGVITEIPGRERIPHYSASWKVTMPTSNTLHITYILEVDPGGNLPAWLANSFIEKGPYGTFSNLADRLKK